MAGLLGLSRPIRPGDLEGWLAPVKQNIGSLTQREDDFFGQRPADQRLSGRAHSEPLEIQELQEISSFKRFRPMIALAVAASELLVQNDSDGILGMYHGKSASMWAPLAPGG